MKRKKVKKLVHGVYRIHWNSGGTSIAAVGSDYWGNRWFAPTNWQSKSKKGNPKVATTNRWNWVKSVELIATE